MPGQRNLSSIIKRTAWIAPLALVIFIPTAAEGAWDLFSSIILTGGRTDNPRFLDPNQPASARRGQTYGTIGLALGTRGASERTEFKATYSPSGEFYEESDLNRLRHDLFMSLDHRFTERLSTKLIENFSYSPDRGDDPNIAALGGVITPETNTLGNDFSAALVFRASEKNSLAWFIRDTQRVFSADQYLDTSRRGAGIEYARTMNERSRQSFGYDFAIFTYRDGEPLPALPPVFDPNSFCGKNPQDPNCIVTPPVVIPADDLGARRHRVYSGYLWEEPGGFHVALDLGYDRLVFDTGDDSVSKPYVKSAVGWNGTRFWSRLGYAQGLDEGGGVLTNAELRRSHAEARVKFTDQMFLDLAASHESRRSLEVAGSPPGSALRSFRGVSTFGYKLPHDWVIFATYGHDRQRLTGTGPVTADIRVNRYALGMSWTFN